MNKSPFRRNVLSAAGQTLVQTAVLFFLYRYLIGRLGIEQIGVWAVVLATASAARVSELGLAVSVTKFVATYRAQGDELAVRETVQTAAISLGAILSVILLAIYPALVRLLPHLLPLEAVPDGRAVLPYALASMWLGAVSGIWLSALDGCLRSDLRAGLVILSTMLFIAIVLVAVPQRGLMGLAIAQVGQGVILTALGWAAVRRVIAGMPAMPTQWRRSRLREMLGYGVNVQVIATIMLLFEPTTKVLFARYGGLSAAGYFELAQQLVTKIRALIVESNRVIVPVLAGMGESGRDPRRLYSKNIEYLVFMLTPLFAILASAVPLLSELWLGYFQTQFVVMAVCLSAAWYLNSVTAPAYFAYLGDGKLRWLTVSHVIMGASNLVIGMILGPVFGWPGVLAAFVLSLALGSAMPVWTYHREHAIELSATLSGSNVVLLIICVGATGLSLLGYWAALRLDSALWVRGGLVIAATVAMLLTAWRHPLQPAVFRLMRGAHTTMGL